VAKPKSPFNPFYALLVLLGIAFTITACAYTVMSFRANKLDLNPQENADDEGLMNLLRQRGGTIMAIEVALLGVTTVAAIGLDQFRQNRDEQKKLAAAIATGSPSSETNSDSQ